MMSLKLDYDHPAAELRTDPTGFIRLTWKPHRRTLAEFQLVMEQFLRLLARQGTGLALIDQRQMPALIPAEQDWTLSDWLPRATRQAGYRYGAVLPADDVIARLATTNILMQAPDWPVYRLFAEELVAIDWLQRQLAVKS
ncbi:hypothetical protein [Hymenobacter sp. BT730]|uniref:hypothetical protein n=1 Tax=Hymenobacter sp. BT730 TaxID=3063332 RepID=UPI0026DFF35B|nr:hypothetical protein [Hymenobacter sp. BT730]